jgi:hypothetical protein
MCIPLVRRSAYGWGTRQSFATVVVVRLKKDCVVVALIVVGSRLTESGSSNKGCLLE